jgi:hypothetical protein
LLAVGVWSWTMPKATTKTTKTPIEKKLAILRMINDKKELLFGKFKNDLENRDKNEAWMVILEKAQSLELVSSSRHWKYIRDTLYSNWKSRATVSTIGI